MKFLGLAVLAACASASSVEESSIYGPVNIASDESVLVLGSAGLLLALVFDAVLRFVTLM